MLLSYETLIFPSSADNVNRAPRVISEFRLILQEKSDLFCAHHRENPACAVTVLNGQGDSAYPVHHEDDSGANPYLAFNGPRQTLSCLR